MQIAGFVGPHQIMLVLDLDFIEAGFQLIQFPKAGFQSQFGPHGSHMFGHDLTDGAFDLLVGISGLPVQGRQEFVSHSQIPLVSKEQAAVVLIGRVVDIKTEALSYKITDGTFEVTTSRWLKIKLAAKLLDRATGKVIWNDDKMEEKASFAVSPDPLKTSYNQRRATKMIAKLLAERIYLKTMERF